MLFVRAAELVQRNPSSRCGALFRRGRRADGAVLGLRRVFKGVLAGKLTDCPKENEGSELIDTVKLIQ